MKLRRGKLDRGRWKGIAPVNVPLGYLHWLAVNAENVSPDLLAEILGVLHDRHAALLKQYRLGHLIAPLPDRSRLIGLLGGDGEGGITPAHQHTGARAVVVVWSTPNKILECHDP